MNFINAKDLHYSKLVKDDNTGVEYETYKRIPGVVSISISPTSNTASYYGDGVQMESVKRLGEITVSIQASSLDLKTQADLLGHAFDEEKGVMVSKADDVAPYHSIAFSRERADGSVRMIKLYKVMFALINEEAQSSNDAITFQDNTLEGNAMPLQYNKEWRRVIEPNDNNTAEVADFFKNVIHAG